MKNNIFFQKFIEKALRVEIDQRCKAQCVVVSNLVSSRTSDMRVSSWRRLTTILVVLYNCCFVFVSEWLSRDCDEEGLSMLTLLSTISVDRRGPRRILNRFSTELTRLPVLESTVVGFPRWNVYGLKIWPTNSKKVEVFFNSVYKEDYKSNKIKNFAWKNLKKNEQNFLTVFSKRITNLMRKKNLAWKKLEKKWAKFSDSVFKEDYKPNEKKKSRMEKFEKKLTKCLKVFEMIIDYFSKSR